MIPDKSTNAETSPQSHTPRTNSWRPIAGLLTTGALAVTLIALCPAPASAGVRIFLGLGLPLYPAYTTYPAYPHVAAPYPYGSSYVSPAAPALYGRSGLVAPPVVVRPTWVRGYWGWRYDHWRHRHRVWVRGHRH